jgi:hypothetical protein
MPVVVAREIAGKSEPQPDESLIHPNCGSIGIGPLQGKR